jgi:putative endonuclease
MKITEKTVILTPPFPKTVILSLGEAQAKDLLGISNSQIQMKQPCVYIMTNHSRTLYIGVTSSIAHRTWEHKEKLIEGFTKKYNIEKLVHYEFFEDMPTAIAREKQLKGWVRRKKIALIEKENPEWLDLYDEL